ncbi:DUF4214 domain-containing protein [Methylobacterium durans]|uniref:DUF4214 domain-containing protein n=1 Tax=Methylobacterium durans TaxID=2202825 RepID=A0A2U8WC45_9HYPH|nr:DUF4214 domain-containing protein [Methylobacterium durans]AWN43188.1 hypothetical protein DK389_25175 [Methylobacterium durans]
MSYTRNVIDVNGGAWTFTLPDQVTLRQGSLVDNFRLDGVSEPLIFDYNLSPDLLFGADYHGIITIGMHEIDPDDPTNTPPTVESANGLRGLIGINFHNNLGITLRNPPSNDTMAFYLAGNSDQFPNTPNAFHTIYTHFHPSGSPLIDAGEFPNLSVTTAVGPFPGAQPGNIATSPNWILLDGTIAPGNYNWGNFSFHRRDLEGSDDTTLNLIFFNGAFDANELAAIRQTWKLSHPDGVLGIGASSAIQGSVSAALEKDIYSLNLIQGQAYKFELIGTSAPLDPVLRLLDSAGTQLAFDDNGGGNVNSQIIFTAPATGPYLLEAGGFLNTTGSYTISATNYQIVVSQPSAFGHFATNAAGVGGQVYVLYDGLLGRAPDALGLEYWADRLEHGVTARDLGQLFLDSPEGQARAGALGNREFVGQLYQATLHREADTGGLDYWTGQLNAGAARIDVASGFVFSAEHLGNLKPVFDAGVFVTDKQAADVARLYYTMLDRAPDAGGLQYWASQLETGGSISDLAKAFLGTPENVSKYGSMQNSDYVEALYDNALGRPADADGKAYWTNLLNGGTSRADLAVLLSDSAESHSVHLSQIELGWQLA